MEEEITVKRIDNYFANGEPGIRIHLFRCEVVLTKEEALKLQKDISFNLCGLYIPDE